MSTLMDGNKSVNWNIINMFCQENAPALIPGVQMTAGNRKLTGNLWLTLSAVWASSNDRFRLDRIGFNYIDLHPKKRAEIVATCTHFTHIMGIHYPVFGDQFNTYAEGIYGQI